jgi:hypothetical protein
MFKNNLINSGKLTMRLILAVVGLFLLMLVLNFLNGGTEAVYSYIESINIRELLAPVCAFFLVTLLLPPVVMLLVSKFNFRVSLPKSKK